MRVKRCGSSARVACPSPRRSRSRAASGSPSSSSSSALKSAALIARWQQDAERAFVEAYRTVERSAENPWVPQGAEADLLDLFLIEKAAYEVRYEAANRPAWIGLPLRGLAALAARVAG